MTILAFPSVLPATVGWGLSSNTQVFTSPLSGSVQTLELPGARWVANLSFKDIERDATAEFEAFIVQLRGASGRFYLHNQGRKEPRGAGGGTPQVVGGGSTGITLPTDGWPSSTLVLKVGDFFSVNDELKMVVQDATTNGAGEVTLTFEPPLRYSPTDNATITTSSATAVMRLTDDKQGKINHIPASLANFTMSAVEAF